MAGLRMAPVAALCVTAVVALLTACDNGPSAVATQQAAGTQMANAEPPARSGRTEREDRRAEATPLVAGKPMWSATRRYSAQENAERAFARNGEAFGARTLDQFVEKAHAFVDHPPAGAETLKRSNGDTLIYDPKGNVFAIATKDGAPRTMFKPDDGKAYWAEQKTREAGRSERRASRADRDDEA